MKRIPALRSRIPAALTFAVAATVYGQQGDTSKAVESDSNRLVYADFQNLQNGRA